MIAVYLTYAEDIEINCGSLLGGDVYQVHPAGQEQHWIDCKDEEHAARVVASWLFDPLTISVRTERIAA